MACFKPNQNKNQTLTGTTMKRSRRVSKKLRSLKRSRSPKRSRRQTSRRRSLVRYRSTSPKDNPSKLDHCAANNQDVVDVEGIVASVRQLFGLLPEGPRNALCAELCTGGMVAVDSGSRVGHAIDPMEFIGNDSYPSVGGWPTGVQCTACGRITSGSGRLSSRRTWIEPDANDPNRNPEAQCWSITDGSRATIR